MGAHEVDDCRWPFHVNPQFLCGHFTTVASNYILGAIRGDGTIAIADSYNDRVIQILELGNSSIEEDAIRVTFFGDPTKDGFKSQ